ncbi:MAG: hypothetical protein JW829_18885, partial [Pirellulales bacterium]|nr:hypothetical protein [Pirellulales bacterium]
MRHCTCDSDRANGINDTGVAAQGDSTAYAGDIGYFNSHQPEASLQSLRTAPLAYFIASIRPSPVCRARTWSPYIWNAFEISGQSCPTRQSRNEV